MITTQELRNQISKIESQLTKENKEYMGKVNGYMVVTAFFHREEEAVTQTVLGLYQDVLDAQKDGMSAKDYLGKDSQQLADELLANLPPLKWYYGLRLTGAMGFLYLGWQFMTDFGTTGSMTYTHLGLLCDLLLGILLPAVAFLVLKQVIYQESKVKSFLMMFGFGSLFVGVALLRLWLFRRVEPQPLPVWATGAVLLAFLAGMLYYRKDRFVLYTFAPAYVVFLFAGFFALYVESQQVPAGHWLAWGHVGISLLAPLLTFIGVALALRKTID